MTTEIDNIGQKRLKMEELAFSEKGRKLVSAFERLNFLREAMIGELQSVSDECDEALYNYMTFIGLEISPDKQSALLGAIARNKERKNKK